MEWTDAARSELCRILQNLKKSLDPAEVDVDEIADDIQVRIEEKLAGAAVITEADVRSAAKQLGVDEIAAEKKEDPMSVQLEKSFGRPARIRSRISTGWLWFTGIILPIAALLTELFTRLCLETGLPDPLPTPVHALLIATVPVFSFLAMHRLKKSGPPSRRLNLLGGIAFITAVYYSILFSMILPFALIGFAAVIYFGLGLICFLPLSPLLSLITISRHTLQLRRQEKLAGFGRGALIGLLVLAVSSAPAYLTKAGLRMAGSENPATALKGIKLLRAAGDETLMNRACYWSGSTSADPISLLIQGGEKIRPETAREIYYRVTGEAFHSKAAPTVGLRTRRNPGSEFDWDPETGGDVVAGRLKGLSLSDSRIDGKTDADAATAYLEWTMVFHNDWKREREARAQIALPPGAVVSRLTLWIDGEEREAAFGGRSQVKQAYKKVVRRRRDPVLVTTCGPDRVLMQCYPVPAGGDMKIRVGITVPLTAADRTTRELILPQFLERNFRIPDSTKHALWIGDLLRTDFTDPQLNDPANTIKLHSDSLQAAYQTADGCILQTIRQAEADPESRIAVVIDSSAAMHEWIEPLAAVLSSLPENLAAEIIVADDEPRSITAKQVGSIKARGGKDNSPALREALLNPEVDQVVWLHGPQTWEFDAGENVRQVLERDSGKKIISYQLGYGPHRLIEKLDNLAGLRCRPAGASPQEDLTELFEQTPAWTAQRVLTDQAGPDVHSADDHLERLYALDRIREDLSDGDNDTSTALELALQHHLVTPVSGAVVLETAQQYKDADLKPIDSKDAPGIPEPSSIILLLLAAVLVFYGRRKLNHFRIRLGFADL